MDRGTSRIFAGCSKQSNVVDAKTGKVVAKIANGDGTDALGYDASQKLIYIPGGRTGGMTVVHQDGPDKYTVVAIVPTMLGTKTLAVDAVSHKAYALALEYGPAPTPAAGTPAGRGGARGPLIGAWLFVISH